MKTRTAASCTLLSAIVLLASASPGDARFGFFAAGQSPAGPAEQTDPAQPSQTDPKADFDTESKADIKADTQPEAARKKGKSPIFSQTAVPLGENAHEHQIMPGSVSVSPDSSNVAYRLRYGRDLGLYGYVYGGHNPVGTSQATDPTFSPDSKTVAAVMADRGWKLRHGKVFLEGYEPVTPPRFSPDGKRIVYLARLEEKRFVVEGDHSQPLADVILWDQLVFTSDSAVMAYPAFDGQYWRMVIDGDPGPNWDSFVTPPLTAERGQRVVYVALKDGRYHVVDRHTPAPRNMADRSVGGFRLIDRNPVLSADGDFFVYWALGDDLVWRLYQNHVHVPGYDADRPGQVVLSDDGQTMAAILKRGPYWYVVQNGQLSEPYTAIGNNSLVLSPDASRLAYAVKKPQGWAVIENDVEHPAYTTIAANSLRFSPDSQRFVYAALTHGQWSVILDGKAQQPFNKIATRTLAFSPNSQKLVYIGYSAGTAHVVLDGDVVGGYDYADQLTFSPDSEHLVWLASDGEQYFLVADGMSSHETFDEPLAGARIHFANNLSCHTVARRPGPSFVRIALKLSVPEKKPAPQKDDTYDPDTTPVPNEPAGTESPFVEVPTE